MHAASIQVLGRVATSPPKHLGEAGQELNHTALEDSDSGAKVRSLGGARPSSIIGSFKTRMQDATPSIGDPPMPPTEELQEFVRANNDPNEIEPQELPQKRVEGGFPAAKAPREQPLAGSREGRLYYLINPLLSHQRTRQERASRRAGGPAAHEREEQQPTRSTKSI